jgi:hypothetical protein
MYRNRRFVYEKGILTIGITVKTVHTKQYRYGTHKNIPVLQHMKMYRYLSNNDCRSPTFVTSYILKQNNYCSFVMP